MRKNLIQNALSHN